MLDRIQNLKKVVWDHEDQITIPIIHALKRGSPSCKLYCHLPSRYWLNDWRPDLEVDEALFGFTNLYAIKAHMHDGYYDYSYFMKFIFSALSENHHIRELDLSTSTAGCEPSADFRAFDFTSYPDARLAPLEVLKLSGYLLDERADGGKGWDIVSRGQKRWTPSTGYNRTRIQATSISSSVDNRTNLEAWMQAMDWSNIRTSDLYSPSDRALTLLGGSVLPALRDLTLDLEGRNGQGEQQDIYDFVLTHTARGLEILSLKEVSSTTGDEILKTIVTDPTQLISLKSFSFGAGSKNVFPLSNTTLKSFMDAAVNLEKADLNVRRQNLSVDHEPFISLVSSTPFST